MLKSICLISILFSLYLLSCKSTKDTTNLSDNSTKTKETTTSTQKNDSVGNYRFIVSFFSPGNGIDHKMKREYEGFISSYKKQITYEQARWGKEGEVDFCFELKELSENEQKEFVKKSKELLSKSSRIHIYENAPCRHKH